MNLSRDSFTIRNAEHHKHNFSFSLLLLSTILQNCYFNNISFSFVCFILDLIIPIITISNGLSDSSSDEIYQKSSFTYVITPKLLSAETWTIISLALTILYIIAFIICFSHKRFCISLHWLLNPNTNLVLLPFFSHTFAYSITGQLELNKLIFIFVYIIYLVISTFLFFFNTNSIIHPNHFFHEWFSGSNFYYPLYIAFVNISFCITNKLEKYKSIVIMVVCSLISVIYSIYIIQKMPFFLLLTNDIVISKIFILCLYSFIIVIRVCFNVRYDLQLIVTMPLIYILIVFIVKIFGEKKRSNIHKILSQIDSSFKQYSVDALATALPSIVKSESTVQWVIKEGIMQGNQSVINKEFLHFCIKKFNRSQWFISLISFLVDANWEGERSSPYRILLHTLSLQNSVFTSLQLFQCVYIMNQISEVEVSQIISRDISSYRFSLHYFAKMHQNFWSSVMQDDEKVFRVSLRNIYSAKVEQKNLIHSLLKKYEFSPSVQLYASLYYSDISQNYIKSGKHYKKAALMRTNREEYISAEILDQFSSLLPKSSKSLLLKKEKNSEDISFLSVRTSHNTALRCQPEVSLNDDFLESLCQSYSIPANIAKQKIFPFAYKTTSAYKIAFVCLMIVYVFFLFLVQYKFYDFKKGIRLFNSRLELIESTVEFRWHLAATSLDIRLLVNIISETYQPFSNNSVEFYYFVVDHLSSLTQKLVKYENQINEIRMSDNSFSNEFGELHNYCQYFITTRDISNLMKTVSDGTLDKLINPLKDISESLYSKFIKDELQKEEKEKKVFCRDFIGIIFGIIIVYVFSIIFFYFITNSIENLLFLILKTVQTVVISEIQEKFNKLFNYDKHRRLNIDDTTVFKAHGLFIFSLLMMALVSLVYPVFNVGLNLISNPSSFQSLPNFINITSDTESIYYTMALNEFGIGHNKKNCIHTYASINLDGFLQPSKMIKVDFNTEVMNVLLIVFIVFFAIFLIELRSSIMMYKFVQVVLKFIPQHAAESSPVLAPLWRGQNLRKSDVIHFKQMILSFKEIENSGFFCLLYFNNTGDVIKTIGNVVDILHCQPKTLWQLVTYIKENSSESSSLIDDFFNSNSIKNTDKKDSNFNGQQNFQISKNASIQSASSQTASISLEAFHEISLTFSEDGKVLTIKDDGHHFIRNQRYRAIMNAKVPSIQQEKASTQEDSIQMQNQTDPKQNRPFYFQFQQSQQNKQQKIIYDNCIIVICEANLSNTKMNANKLLNDDNFQTYSNSPIFETNQHSSSEFEDTENGEECNADAEFPNINNKLEIDFKTVLKRNDLYIMICDACYAKILLKIVKKLHVKTVAHENGQICVFQRSKLSIKPQIFGQAFDEARAMMMLAENADFIVSKNFWTLTNENPIEFETFNFGVNMSFDIHRFVQDHLPDYYI